MHRPHLLNDLVQRTRLIELLNHDIDKPLIPSELEILKLLREPINVKEIAQKLPISNETNNRYIANIYAKLVVSQR
jgi:DNA-binding NarL/FixJ family response regulator